MNPYEIEDVADVITTAIKTALAPLRSRIEVLEARLATQETKTAAGGCRWAGVFHEGRVYPEGSLLTHNGSLWFVPAHLGRQAGHLARFRAGRQAGRGRAMNVDQEPTVTLRDGSTVTLALFEWCRDLLAAGHIIRVREDGAVQVQPPCHPDVQYHLEASWRDTAAIVADLTTPGTVH